LDQNGAIDAVYALMPNVMLLWCFWRCLLVLWVGISS